jgi:hypothetical protein
MGFTVLTKSLNSPPLRELFLLPFVLQEQIDPTVWTDEMTVG